MDENQQPSFQDKINQKDCSAVQRGGGSGGESRQLYSVGAGKLSASTTTDKNTSSAAPSTTKWAIAEVWGQKTCGDSQ